MSNIKYVSHKKFSNDPYTKELVYILIDDKYRVAYVRKANKNGGMFWSTINASITDEGNKAYYESFMIDSSFMEKDIKTFLDNRSWEKKGSVFKDDDVPF